MWHRLGPREVIPSHQFEKPAQQSRSAMFFWLYWLRGPGQKQKPLDQTKHNLPNSPRSLPRRLCLLFSSSFPMPPPKPLSFLGVLASNAARHLHIGCHDLAWTCWKSHSFPNPEIASKQLHWLCRKACAKSYSSSVVWKKDCYQKCLSSNPELINTSGTNTCERMKLSLWLSKASVAKLDALHQQSVKPLDIEIYNFCV